MILIRCYYLVSFGIGQLNFVILPDLSFVGNTLGQKKVIFDKRFHLPTKKTFLLSHSRIFNQQACVAA